MGPGNHDFHLRLVPKHSSCEAPDKAAHVAPNEHSASKCVVSVHGDIPMTPIKEHMEIIGADGVHVGTVDKVEGNRIKLTKKDSGEGSHKGHHHYIDRGLVAGVEGNKVR